MDTTENNATKPSIKTQPLNLAELTDLELPLPRRPWPPPLGSLLFNESFEYELGRFQKIWAALELPIDERKTLFGDWQAWLARRDAGALKAEMLQTGRALLERQRALLERQRLALIEREDLWLNAESRNEREEWDEQFEEGLRQEQLEAQAKITSTPPIATSDVEN